MKKIRAWLTARGWRLRKGLHFACEPETRTVYYPPNAGYNARVLYLLHECGHVLCGERFAYWLDPVDQIHEECEAWYRGWRLARRLRIRVSRRLYLQARRVAIGTYARGLG